MQSTEDLVVSKKDQDLFNPQNTFTEAEKNFIAVDQSIHAVSFQDSTGKFGAGIQSQFKQYVTVTPRGSKIVYDAVDKDKIAELSFHFDPQGKKITRTRYSFIAMLAAIGGMYFTMDFIFGLIKGWVDGPKEDLIEFEKINQVYRYPKQVTHNGEKIIVFQGLYSDHRAQILKNIKEYNKTGEIPNDVKVETSKRISQQDFAKIPLLRQFSTSSELTDYQRAITWYAKAQEAYKK